MAHIKNLLPKAVESIVTSGQETKARPASTPELERFEFRFETFGDPQLVEMLSAAKQFCAELVSGRNPHWLSFLGSSGAGKTHLAKRITAFFRQHVQYYSEPRTAATIKRQGGLVSWGKVVNDLREGDYTVARDLSEDFFVCIDDIGSEHGSQFVSSKLYEIADSRIEKWTVLTSNLSLEEIGRIETRIASRMLRNESEVIDIDVQDYNLRRTAA